MIRTISVFAVSVLLGVTAVQAQSSDPGWLEALRTQLASEQSCEAQYFLNIRESQTAAGTIYEARVQCVDGRMFDAIRKESDMNFSITACGQVICQAAPDADDKS